MLLEGTGNATGLGAALVSTQGISFPSYTLALQFHESINLSISAGKMSDQSIYYEARNYAIKMSPVITEFSIGFHQKSGRYQHFGTGFRVGYGKGAGSGRPESGNGGVINYRSRAFSVVVEPYWLVPTANPNTVLILSIAPTMVLTSYEMGNSVYGYRPPKLGPDFLSGVSLQGTIHTRLSEAVSMLLEYGWRTTNSVNYDESTRSTAIGLALVFHSGARRN
jgi:hypothetical protein